MADQNPNPEGLLTDRKVSKRYGIPLWTLRKMRVQGGGPPFIKIGRSVFYKVADVEAWINAHRRKSTSDRGSERTAEKNHPSPDPFGKENFDIVHTTWAPSRTMAPDVRLLVDKLIASNPDIPESCFARSKNHPPYRALIVEFKRFPKVQEGSP
jgi:predicted DNA-binding transcriptional regulator AlpA